MLAIFLALSQILSAPPIPSQIQLVREEPLHMICPITVDKTIDELCAKFEYIKKFTQEERDSVDSIAKHIDRPSEDIYKLFYLESSGNYKSQNDSSGGYGYINMTKRTAKEYGTSLSKIKQMSSIEQLKLVDRYLTRELKGIKPKNFTHVYLSVLYPAAVNKPDSYRIFKTKKQYEWNKIFDKDKKGYICVADVENYLKQKQI